MKNKQKILITGSNGQLGSELKDLAALYSKYNFLFVDKEQLDITSEKDVTFFFKENKIDFCVNGAAYTAVDNAEKDSKTAYLVNAEAVNFISKACKINNTKLIQISTDFVFDGKATKPYVETDESKPLNVYAETKLKGEKFALENDALVLRTSWLYSSYGHNFVKTMLRLGSERDSLNIISDQIGTPTYAKDLAEVILLLISSKSKEKIKGLYHFSNLGTASWYDFATEIFKIAKVDCTTNPIPTTEYPTPAERPKYSLMDKSKIQNNFGIKLIDWKVSLAICLQKINIQK